MSPFVERIFLQVRAKGLNDVIEFPGIAWDQLKTPDYLKISPFGKVPALVWGDFTLFESTVIMEFLEDQFPENPMFPKDPMERARARLVIRILDTYYHVHTVALMDQVGAKERNQKYTDRHLKGIGEALDVLEQIVSGEKYIVGDTLTLADTTLYASILLGRSFAPSFGKDYFFKCPKLAAWYNARSAEELFAESNKVRSQQIADFMKCRT